MTERNNILSNEELDAIHQAWGELCKTTDLVADAVILLMRQVSAMYECVSGVLPPPPGFEYRPWGEQGVLDADLQLDLAKEDNDE